MSRLPQLTALECNSCLHTPVVLALPRLTSLVYKGTLGLTDICQLGSGDSLRHLSLAWSRDLISIGALATCRNLTLLDLSGCVELTVDIGALEASRHTLTALYISQCRSVVNLAALSSCQQLTALHMSGLAAVPALSDLGCLAKSCIPRLTSLGLGGCSNLADVSALAACTSLTFVDLSRCTALTDIRALASSRFSLRYVDVRGSGATLANIMPGDVDSVREGYDLR